MAAGMLTESFVADDVTAWRLEQLELTGYPPFEAFVLARRPDIDLRLASQLLGAGCPVVTAMEILL
jgi:hypothetical protein